MSTGNFIAIIAAAGAVIAVVVGWIQANATLKQNRELTDLGAVRSVLDEAVMGLLDAATPIAQIREFKDRPRRLEPAWEAAERAGRRIATELERMKLRFGLEHPIVKAFEGTVAACSAVTKAADEMIDRKRIGMNTGSSDEIAAKSAALNARRERNPAIIEQESERFETERTRFIKTAHSLAGTKLSSPHKPTRAAWNPLPWPGRASRDQAEQVEP